MIFTVSISHFFRFTAIPEEPPGIDKCTGEQNQTADDTQSVHFAAMSLNFRREQEHCHNNEKENIHHQRLPGIQFFFEGHRSAHSNGGTEDQCDIGHIASGNVADHKIAVPESLCQQTGRQFRQAGADTDQRQPDDQFRYMPAAGNGCGSIHKNIAAFDQNVGADNENDDVQPDGGCTEWNVHNRSFFVLLLFVLYFFAL